MRWIEIEFGKYKGKGCTIPQIAFKDWNYFQWCIQKGAFKGDLLEQAKLVEHNLKNLRLPENLRDTHCIQFLHDSTGKLSDVRVADLRHISTAPSHNEVRSSSLNVVWKTDGIGRKLVIDAFKKHWLGGKSITKARLEALLADQG